MNENKFYIDFCLNIYSKPVIWDGEVKKYNPQTGYFEEISNNDKNFIKNAIEIDLDVARDVITNTFHSLYGYCLNFNDEKWLEKYEIEKEKRSDLKTDKNLIFNYLVLKASIAGVPDYISTQLYAHFLNPSDDSNYSQTLNDIINVLDSYKKQKKYWVPILDDKYKKEFSIIDDIMLKRISSTNFDFKFFEARYLKICNDGYLKDIAFFNITKNKYSNNIYEMKDLVEPLLKFYKIKTNEFMDILADKYPYFKTNPASRTMIYKNMEDIMKYSMRFWENL